MNRIYYCMMCGKKTDLPFTIWVSGSTCSKACNDKFLEAYRG